jgi:hypothetical protein
VNLIKAGDLAIELRKFADRLESQPDAMIDNPSMYFIFYSKEPFLAFAKLMPRPLKKSVRTWESSAPDLRLTYDSPLLTIVAKIPQSLTCTLVKPAQEAVYECDPILSEAEDAELEVTL